MDRFELDGHIIVRTTRKELKELKASDFKDGDRVIVNGKYWINIKYGNYKKPSLCSFVMDGSGKILDCTPGLGWPYYIDSFLHT